MNIAAYLEEIRKLAASGQATEHSYRPALERLFTSIDPALTVINEPKQSAVGALVSKQLQNGLNCQQRVDQFARLIYGAEQSRNMLARGAQI